MSLYTTAYIQEEEVISCPYNKNHRFPKSDLVYHLSKCKEKKTKAHLFGVCKFNELHIMPRDELKAHETYCKDA